MVVIVLVVVVIVVVVVVVVEVVMVVVVVEVSGAYRGWDGAASWSACDRSRVVAGTRASRAVGQVDRLRLGRTVSREIARGEGVAVVVDGGGDAPPRPSRDGEAPPASEGEDVDGDHHPGDKDEAIYTYIYT